MSANHNKIGLFAAVVIGMNAMIGVGIVTLPAVFAHDAGPSSILAFIITIATVLCFGIALGRVALKYPGEGWTYLYPSKWGGHNLGLFSGFSYLAGVLIAMGFLIQQAGIWSHKILSFIPAQPLGIGITLILMLIVLKGVHASEIGQFIIGGCVVIPLIITSIVCFMHFDPSLLTPFMPHGITPVFSAAATAMFSVLGFECIVSLYSVVENPQINVPRAFILSIVSVGTLYLLFVTGLTVSIHPSYFSEGLSVPLSHVLEQVLTEFPFVPIAVLIGAVFGIIGTLHSMLWSTSALFTDVLKKVKSPFVKNTIAKGFWNNTVSVLVSTAIMLASSLVGEPKALVALTIMFMIFPNVLSLAALFFYKAEWKSGRNIIAVVAFFCRMHDAIP